MNYVRTNSGSMMAITFGRSQPVALEKRTVAVKPEKLNNRKKKPLK